ncbi:hypothetical protein [Arthrobacter sp. cf158]|uniref:hypothetical protein n=1 Tax=Arthrobacter sp. cf158 TaxID=1761744 RepID=UPI0020C8B554|nr:hypothetical protein [Arthrobacter sp. cf158]
MAASCWSATDGALVPDAGADGGVEGAGDRGGDVACAVVGTGVPDDAGAEADGDPSVAVGAELPLPVEQPDAMARKAPAAAMLIPRDAIVWVLRMVNR